MGILIKEKLEEDLIFGLWEIQEDLEELLNTVTIDKEERVILENFKSYPRKLEWLSVRALLKNCIRQDIRILYNGNRKPYLENHLYHISISHSGNYTSILLSKHKKVGLDMEYMSHRISNIRSKFMNENEYVTEDPGLQNYHLYVHWCAKEALYKLLDKKNISFKDHIMIKPFQPGEKGSLKGTVQNEHFNHEFDLHFFSMHNYIIVWSSST